MLQPNRPLKVFLYHGAGNPHAVRALGSRLVDDGVDVTLFDNERSSLPAVAAVADRIRETALRTAIRESDIVLICLSSESIQVEQSKEIEFVSAAVVEKTQGELFVTPVCFEKCDVPDVLKRWQAVDLFEETGYERLMQALKLRADKLGVVLEPNMDWPIPFQWDEEKSDASQEREQDSRITFLTTVVVVLVIALLMLWGLPGIFKSAFKTAVPVEVMVENSTQRALEQSMNRSMTQTALAQIARLPITQTAAAEGTLQNPATPTIQFPTIIALPTELIDPGNIKMVYVPGDNIVIGNENDSTGVNPAHTIYIEPFYIDKYEVTNVFYHLCAEAGGCEPPKNIDSQIRPVYYGNIEFNEYPVVNVTWLMAKQYCEWRGARLPTEAEWEKAARSIDGRNYPWGDGPSCSFANYADAGGVCVGDTTAIGIYIDGRSLYGAFDMSGNVSEWVNSLYWTYPYLPTDGREDTTSTGLRVVRGGSWMSPLEEITTYYRLGVDPSTYDLNTGFRCARDADL